MTCNQEWFQIIMRAMAKSRSRVEAALAALDRASLRKTPQRLAIVRAFVDDPSHPTAQVLFDRLRPELPTMSFATVYNTLAALERAGACRTLRLDGPAGDDGVRFDPFVEPHDHAVCDTCGAVIDLPRRPREGPKPRVDGFRVRAVERIVRGTCAGCARVAPSP